MGKHWKTKLILAATQALLLNGVTSAAFAQEKTDLMSPKALHTPEACDVKMTVADLFKIKPPKANKRYKISYSMVSLAGYYYQATAYGAMRAAQEAGADVKFVASQGWSSQADQVTNIRNQLAQGIDGLLVNPVDVNGAVSIVEEAVDKGIPTVAIGTNVNTSKVDRVVQDSYFQGVAAADFIASKLPQGGQGILMGGPANATWAARRVAGFQDGLKKHPNIKISAVTNQDVDPAAGLKDFNNAAQSDPKVDWIYVTYNLQLPPDTVPPKYADSIYVGGGLEPLMIDALKAGTASAGLPSYPAAVGYIGMSALIRRLNGDKTPPQLICLPADEVVTKDGLEGKDMSNELYPEGWKATEAK